MQRAIKDTEAGRTSNRKPFFEAPLSLFHMKAATFYSISAVHLQVRRFRELDPQTFGNGIRSDCLVLCSLQRTEFIIHPPMLAILFRGIDFDNIHSQLLPWHEYYINFIFADTCERGWFQKSIDNWQMP